MKEYFLDNTRPLDMGEVLRSIAIGWRAQSNITNTKPETKQPTL